jgi:ABC-type cobalamin/Fe3+-siderophores transport system ATPase subunit
MIKQDHDISTPWRVVCEQLSVSRGGRTVLHDIELGFGSGECISLIGPNGSGKTTLMLTLLGLLPAASGRVQIDGREVAKLPARVRGRFASYVPQTVERIPAFSLWEVVASGRFPHVSPLRPLSHADREHVSRALDLCGLTALAQRRIDAVSGGERQKALIAAAIAQDAQVMFLDEPNTALDPAYQIELVRLLRRWCDGGRALVAISHDLNLPAALGGRVVALRGGCIAADGDATEILDPARLTEVYGASFEVAETSDGRRIVVPNWWKSEVAPA